MERLEMVMSGVMLAVVELPVDARCEVEEGGVEGELMGRGGGEGVVGEISALEEGGNCGRVDCGDARQEVRQRLVVLW